MTRALLTITAGLGSLLAAGLALGDAKPPKADADMQAVLDAHASLGPKPIPTLTPDEARKQPTMADAAKIVAAKKQKNPPVAEAVAKVEDRELLAADGKTMLPLRIYTPAKGTAPFPITGGVDAREKPYKLYRFKVDGTRIGPATTAQR